MAEKDFDVVDLGYEPRLCLYKRTEGEQPVAGGAKDDFVEAFERASSTQLVSNTRTLFDDLLGIHLAGGHVTNVTLFKACQTKVRQINFSSCLR